MFSILTATWSYNIFRINQQIADQKEYMIIEKGKASGETVTASVDWTKVIYVDNHLKPLSGLVPLNRPDILANEGIYGFTKLKVGDRVYLLDASETEADSPISLEQITTKPTQITRSGSFLELDSSQVMPDHCPAPVEKLSEEGAQKLSCDHCGVKMPSIQVSRPVTENKILVENRSRISPLTAGSGKDIQKQLIKLMIKEPSAVPQIDELWDGLMEKGEALVPGLAEMVKKVLPAPMHGALDSAMERLGGIPAILKSDLLKGYRANMIATVLTAPELGDEVLASILGDIPGMSALLGKIETSVKLYGPFHENEIADGQIVATKVVDIHHHKEIRQLMLPESHSNFSMPQTPSGYRLAYMPIKGEHNFAGMSLVDGHNNPVGLDILFAITKDGVPINLQIPLSQLKQWDVRAPNGTSLLKGVESSLGVSASDFRIYDHSGIRRMDGVSHKIGSFTSETPFGWVSAGMLNKDQYGNRDERWSFDRFGVVFTHGEARLTFPWQDGFQVVPASTPERIVTPPEIAKVASVQGVSIAELRGASEGTAQEVRDILEDEDEIEEPAPGNEFYWDLTGEPSIEDAFEDNGGYFYFDDDLYHIYPQNGSDLSANQRVNYRIGGRLIKDAGVMTIHSQGNKIDPIYVMRMDDHSVLMAVAVGSRNHLLKGLELVEITPINGNVDYDFGTHIREQMAKFSSDKDYVAHTHSIFLGRVPRADLSNLTIGGSN